MFDIILFDLDNTLLDFNWAERNALLHTLPSLGIEPSEAVIRRYSELNLAQWKLLELGKLTREEVKLRRYKLLFEEIGSDASPYEAVKIYESYLCQGHCFLPDAEDVLKTLCSSRQLYLVTNGTAAVQKGRIESAGLSRYFRDFFISEEIGYNKPFKEYFDYCFSHIPNFQKESCVIVGDSLSSDIKGGKNAGIQTVWFNPALSQPDFDIQPDYEIHALKELLTIL